MKHAECVHHKCNKLKQNSKNDLEMTTKFCNVAKAERIKKFTQSIFRVVYDVKQTHTTFTIQHINKSINNRSPRQD